MARRTLVPFGFGGSLAERGMGDPFLALHREMNRLFDDTLRGMSTPGAGNQGGMVMPHMDVTETEKEIRVCAELPGVSENDIDITLNDDLLTIRGEKRSENQQERQNWHVMERSFGTFQRSLRLPFPVDPNQVQARFENGVLTVTVPKTQIQQQSRRIQVQGSQGQSGQGQGSQAQGAQAQGGRTGQSAAAQSQQAQAPTSGSSGGSS